MAKVIESFEAVLEEMSKEVKKIMDAPLGNTEEKVAFILYFNTLRDMGETVFEYLPPGDRKLIIDLCAAWMDAGLILGKSPKLLVDILKRTKAKIEERGGDKSMT